MAETVFLKRRIYEASIIEHFGSYPCGCNLAVGVSFDPSSGWNRSGGEEQGSAPGKGAAVF
jgi:hypothetical protein